MLQVTLKILPIFLVIGAGAALKCIRVADDRWVDALNRYGLFVGFPALVLDNLIALHPAEFDRNIAVFRLNIILILSLILLTFVAVKLLRLRKAIANSYVVSGFFGNIAYLGYPVVTSIDGGLRGELSVIIAVYVVLLFTVGVAFLEISKAGRLNVPGLLLNLVKNPLLIATAVGIVASRYGLRTPLFLSDTLGMLKASASPVVLLALGVFIVRRIELGTIYAHVVAITVLRLLVVPGLFFAVGTASNLMPAFSVSVIESAMPLALTPFALSAVYPLDRDTIGSAIVLSTLISVVSLPLIVSFLY